MTDMTELRARLRSACDQLQRADDIAVGAQVAANDKQRAYVLEVACEDARIAMRRIEGVLADWPADQPNGDDS